MHNQPRSPAGSAVVVGQRHVVGALPRILPHSFGRIAATGVQQQKRRCAVLLRQHCSAAPRPVPPASLAGCGQAAPPTSSSSSIRGGSVCARAGQAVWPPHDGGNNNGTGGASDAASGGTVYGSSARQQPQPPPAGTDPALSAAATSSLDALLAAAQDAADSAGDSVSAASRTLKRLSLALSKPDAVLIREGCQLLACLLFILLYVWSTYSPVLPGSGRWWLDLVLSLLFAADYLHRMLTTSRHPLLAALHPLALIDLLSFVPSLLGAVLPEVMAPWGLDLRWFRVFRALRLLRLSLLSGNLSTMKTNRGVLIAGRLNVPLVWLVASVVAWMFTSASCVAVLERLPFHDALYFVGSTLTTVGYGDVVVRSSMGRLFVLIMMLVGVVLIPVRAGQLYSRLSERLLSVGHRPGDAPGCRGGYVLLSGRLSDVRGFNDFLQDFLVQVRNLPGSSPAGALAAPAGGRHGLQLVCLCNKPSVEFLALQELHEANLALIEGSAFSEQDLITRGGLTGSLGVMVLADRFSSNAAAEDTDVQFRVWAIKSAAKRVPLYVQVLRRSAVDVISPFLDPAQDVILSVEGIRMRLLALSTLVPGSSTLITNLLRSSGSSAGLSTAGPPGGGSGSGRGRGSSRAAARLAAAVASAASSISGSISGSLSSIDDAGGAAAGSDSHHSQRRTARDAAGKRGGGGGGGGGQPRSSSPAKLAGRSWLREYANGAHCELFFVPAGAPLAGLRFAGAAEAVYEASGAMLVGVIETSEQRLMLNPSSLLLQHGQQLVVLAASQRIARAAAAGAGLEQALQTQALRAAQAAAAAAAAAVVAGAAPGSTAAGAAAAHAGAPAGATLQHASSSLSPLPAASRTGLVVSQQPSVAALPPSSSQQQGRAGPTGHNSSSRAVRVRVPQLKEQDLIRASRDFDDEEAASSAASYASSTPSSGSSGSSSSSSGRSSPNRQRQVHGVEQQPMLHQPAAPQGVAAGADFAASGHYQDAYATFAQQQQQLALSSAAAAAGQDQEGEDGDDEPLLPGCLAPWSGAYESDSLDETELCTDSELAEASLLQQQRRQQQQQARGGGEAHAAAGGALPLPPLSAAPAVVHQHQQPPPAQLAGHFIVAGCASSFVPFARQLAASAPPEAEPLSLVLLHPEHPGPTLDEVRGMGISAQHVAGRASDASALVAAGARRARSLVFVGPSERPTNLPVTSVSGVYGDQASAREASATADGSRTAVLADADALSSCYGVGEVFRPDSLSTIVELGFTSSIRFLQPGLLLEGRPAPHSSSTAGGSVDEPAAAGLLPARLARVLQALLPLHSLIRSTASSEGGSACSNVPQLQHQQAPWLWRQQRRVKLPRSSYRHRKQIEEAGQLEGLTEWQLNSYYAAGRVMVPALLDAFTCQGFFKRRALLELMAELAGDDGRPGGAMLQQLPVPPHLVGRPYAELVQHLLTAPEPRGRHVPLGLLRRKAENRVWRLPYVATHPAPATTLAASDLVFVLRPQ